MRYYLLFIMLLKYILCMIDVSTKYAQVKSLKDIKAKTTSYGFTEIVNEFKRKASKLWVDKGK